MENEETIDLTEDIEIIEGFTFTRILNARVFYGIYS